MKKGTIGFVLAFIGALLISGFISERADAREKSRVVIVRSNSVVDADNRIAPEILKKMLERTMMEFYQVKTPEEGWKKAFRPEDRVAIKINALSGWYAPDNSSFKACTRPEFAHMVAEGAVSAGVKPDNTVIFERNSQNEKGPQRHEMIKAGFVLNSSKDKVRVEEGGAFGPEEKLSNGLNVNFLKQICDSDKLVNMPVLKAHPIMGFTFALKNHLGSYKNADTQSINNTVPPGSAFSLHDNAGVPGVAALNAHPTLKSKPSLIIGDMIRVQYRTAFYDPEGSWAYNGIIVGTDPVAVDSIAWSVLKEKREELGVNYFIGIPMDRWYMLTPQEREKLKIFPDKMKNGGKAGAYLEDCARAGQGKCSRDDIELITIDMK
ncbi:MAG: DUF362 domain-containing protein [Vulcanimicrobiota bacterium]